jgi:NRPS condensation-like uncharacterized protein
MIPPRLPTVAADRMIASWQEIGIIEMMIQLEAAFDRALDADRLARAFELSLCAEPVAGCRFVRGRRGLWERLAAPAAEAFAVSNDAGAYDRFLVEPMNLFSGPQVRVFLLRKPDGDRLAVKVSHGIADAGGTKHYVRALSSIYRALGDDASFVPAPNLAGLRGIGQLFRALPLRAHPRVILNFWRELWGLNVPVVTHRIDLPLCDPAPRGFAVRHLPAEKVALISAYGRVSGATLNDILMAAFARAQIDLGRWDGTSHLRLQTTVDLRRYLPGQRTGAVCNLSAFDYAFLGTDPGTDFDDTLKRITAITRRRKADWTGITLICAAPIMWSMGFAAMTRTFRRLFRRGIEQRNQPNALTNMGPIAPEDVDFGVRPLSAWLLTPPINPPLFGVGLTGYAGTVTLSAGAPVPALPVVETFLDAMLAKLP